MKVAIIEVCFKVCLRKGQQMEKQPSIYSILGQTVTVTINRPIGSILMLQPLLTYLVNYGYVASLLLADASPVEAYVIGVDRPLKSFEGKVVALIKRYNLNDYKLVVGPINTRFTKNAIRKLTHFQEQFHQALYIFLD